MIERDVLGMTEEESDEYFAGVTDMDQAIEKIVDLDPDARSLTWADGSKLNFDDSVDRIHAQYPGHSKQMIHEHLRSWLEQGELPDGLSDDELERLDLLVSQWADEIPDHPAD